MEQQPTSTIRSLNAPSPANPGRVHEQQREVSEAIHERVMCQLPEHWKTSMIVMVDKALMSTAANLSIETATSYRAARDELAQRRLQPTPELQAICDRYEEGSASPAEIVEAVECLQLDSAELLKRTDLTSGGELPDQLAEGLSEVYAAIGERMGPEDQIGILRTSAHVKQLDRFFDQGGLDGMITSSKRDFATVGDGTYTLTQREKYIIDVEAMPVPWRSGLRKYYEELKTQLKKEHRNGNGASDRLQQETLDLLLDFPNPENPEQTLRTIEPTTDGREFVYGLTWTVYMHRRTSER